MIETDFKKVYESIIGEPRHIWISGECYHKNHIKLINFDEEEDGDGSFILVLTLGDKDDPWYADPDGNRYPEYDDISIKNTLFRGTEDQCSLLGNLIRDLYWDYNSEDVEVKHEREDSEVA